MKKDTWFSIYWYELKFSLKIHLSKKKFIYQFKLKILSVVYRYGRNHKGTTQMKMNKFYQQ